MTKNNLLLLSHILRTDTPSYGNRDKLIIESLSNITEGATANSSKWIFSSNHLGTHIDTPKHFFDNGKTIIELPLSFWFSDKIQLIDIPLNEACLVKVDDVVNKINYDIEVLLIRTGYEKFRETDKYWCDNPGISAEVGYWLRGNYPKIKMIGFDFISLTSWKFRDEGKKAHKAFLNPDADGNSICIIEDMSLNNINHTINKINVIPIFIENANGSPVTVFANMNSL